MAKKKQLRSQSWFGREDIYGFIYRSWVKNRGVPHDQFDGRTAFWKRAAFRWSFR